MANAIQDQIISFKSRDIKILPIKNLMIGLQRSGQNIDYGSLVEYLSTTEYNVSGDVIHLVDEPNMDVEVDDFEDDKIDKSLVKTARKGLKD